MCRNEGIHPPDPNTPSDPVPDPSPVVEEVRRGFLRINSSFNTVSKTQIGSHNEGLVYEDYCFETLARMFPDRRFLGSRFVERMLTRTFRNSVRIPDLMELSLDEKGAASLLGLIECKPGRLNSEVLEKLEGFHRLLMTMRANPELTDHMFQSRLEPVIPSLKRIIVPENSEVYVRFLGHQQPPRSRFGSGEPNEYGFPFTFDHFPMDTYRARRRR